MVSFIAETLEKVKSQHSDTSEIIFVLPSKRAGSFLRNQLRKDVTKTQFVPQIVSIEEFVEELSQLSILGNTELLFKSYQSYLQTKSIKKKDSFEDYSTWAITLLNDFNEIDRYMVPAKDFFGYLADIKTIERWGVEKENSPIISNYLQFWESLSEFYSTLKTNLEKENTGFQGMVYRAAAQNIDHYIEKHSSKTHVFLGFNALNTAEQEIIQSLLTHGNAEIYWDTDQSFVENTTHTASYFIRKYLKEWDYFKDKSIGFPSNFDSPKKFKIVEAQKNVGQAKYVGELLSTLSSDQLNKTAIVLGDESLLIPLLHSLPQKVSHINITMGKPIKDFPASTFFERLFTLQLKPGENIYYKEIMAILSHPFGQVLVSGAPQIIHKLNTENITHISSESLISSGSPIDRTTLSLLFESWEDNGQLAIKNALILLETLLEKTISTSIEALTAHKLLDIFKNIKGLSETYPYIHSVKSVLTLLNEIMETTTLDFEGDAFEGLQVMGVLETRVLDFENVIITSVNEGIFPSGKSNSSYITYDLKQQFQLPLYMEKDAIYTYHFYRLLQRAKNVTLLFNRHSEGMNTGEKSRFISQLEVDPHPNHAFERSVLSTQINIDATPPKTIEKTDKILTRIAEIAKKGFSPSALTSYIRNPIDFYFQKILKLQDVEEVEETVAANTLGTIVHDTLETFYKPLEGSLLTLSVLEKMKDEIHEEVSKQFQKTFKGGVFSRGKNLIIFEVAKRYIHNLINLEISEIQNGNEIRIVEIESRLTMPISIPELQFPVQLAGIVDRVDTYNGKLRIIDYKTGNVAQGDVEIMDWETIIEDYKHSKAFQVLAYASMISGNDGFEKAVAGIISFKNLSSGFLPFGTKTSSRSKRNNDITHEVLETFQHELKKLIMEICDPNIPFIEKEI